MSLHSLNLISLLLTITSTSFYSAFQSSFFNLIFHYLPTLLLTLPLNPPIYLVHSMPHLTYTLNSLCHSLRSIHNFMFPYISTTSESIASRQKPQQPQNTSPPASIKVTSLLAHSFHRIGLQPFKIPPAPIPPWRDIHPISQQPVRQSTPEESHSGLQIHLLEPLLNLQVHLRAPSLALDAKPLKFRQPISLQRTFTSYLNSQQVNQHQNKATAASKYISSSFY